MQTGGRMMFAVCHSDSFLPDSLPSSSVNATGQLLACSLEVQLDVYGLPQQHLPDGDCQDAHSTHRKQPLHNLGQTFPP